MVFIHGGAFASGAADQQNFGVTLYDARRLARDQDLVVVTFNYRLGPFGFLVDPAFAEAERGGAFGNYGILDQLAALRFVREHIADFGGDPEQVTVFGESAGAVSICALLTSPLANDLFQRAILESGNCASFFMSADDARASARTRAIASNLGCDSGDDACLRSRSTEDVFNAYLASDPGFETTLLDPLQLLNSGLLPIVDGQVLDQRPIAAIESGRFHRMATIIGSNVSELGLFTAGDRSALQSEIKSWVAAFAGPETYDRMWPLYRANSEFANADAASIALGSDVIFTCDALRTARAFLAQNAPVYRYSFARVVPGLGVPLGGAFHAAELLYIFEQFDAAAFVFGSPTDVTLSHQIAQRWARFADDGDPGWPAFDSDREIAIRFDAQTETRDRIRFEECAAAEIQP